MSETANSVTFTTNAGKQRNRGVEASLSYLVLNAFRPWASYTYTDARYIDFQTYDGNQVARVPKNFLTAGLDVHAPLGFYANGTFQHVDKVPVTFDNPTGFVDTTSWAPRWAIRP